MKNYDPKQYVLVFKGIRFRGYHSGTVIEVERMTDTFTEDVGADGDVVRVRGHDRRGTVTVTLQGTSPVNDMLSLVAAVGEDEDNTDADVGSLTLKDLNGTTVAFASEAWIVKPPNVPVAMEHTPRVWVIRCAKLNLYVGGAAK